MEALQVARPVLGEDSDVIQVGQADFPGQPSVGDIRKTKEHSGSVAESQSYSLTFI